MMGNKNPPAIRITAYYLLLSFFFCDIIIIMIPLGHWTAFLLRFYDNKYTTHDFCLAYNTPKLKHMRFFLCLIMNFSLCAAYILPFSASIWIFGVIFLTFLRFFFVRVTAGFFFKWNKIPVSFFSLSNSSSFFLFRFSLNVWWQTWLDTNPSGAGTVWHSSSSSSRFSTLTMQMVYYYCCYHYHYFTAEIFISFYHHHDETKITFFNNTKRKSSNKRSCARGWGLILLAFWYFLDLLFLISPLCISQVVMLCVDWNNNNHNALRGGAKQNLGKSILVEP